MSNIRKISEEVIRYVVERKIRTPELDCRKLSQEASTRFNIKISKSSINSIILKNSLSSPVGRKTSRIYNPCQDVSGCGYSLLLGANYKLGLSEIVANCLKAGHPMIHLSESSVETITLAWMMSRAFYNVALDRIADYRKNDIWPLIGRKVAKGHLQRYLEMFKTMQTVNNNIVTELSHVLQDVHCLKISLADKSIFYLDGQGQSVWSDNHVPINFTTTINIANSYANKIISGSDPLYVFSGSPGSVLGEEFKNFIFGLDGSVSEKRIEKMDCIGLKGAVIKEVTNIVPLKRKFVVGVWPWQMKSVDDTDFKKAHDFIYLESLGLKFTYSESPIKYIQHINNKEVVLRMIFVKESSAAAANVVLLTNIHPEEAPLLDIVGTYVRRYPFFEAGHRFFSQAVKNPAYADDFIAADKIFLAAKGVLECRDPDQIFSILVDVLHLFSKRCFFPPSCSGWSWLKMREIFYKRPGRIRRDLSGDVVFNIFDSNVLQEKEEWEYASMCYNESGIFEPSGKKFWLTFS